MHAFPKKIMLISNSKKNRRGAAFATTAALSIFFAAGSAAFAANITVDATAKANLQSVYSTRPDLQKFFDENGVATAEMKQRGLSSLEEWAQKYGSKEYPVTLAAYMVRVPAVPRALKERASLLQPVKSTKNSFAPPRHFSAQAYMVVDDRTRKVLLAKNAKTARPLASISKLMTALVSMDHGLSLSGTGTIVRDDEVGGARLRVDPGTPLAIRDIFDSMLIGSANNAANAVARSTGLAKDDFVKAMNDRAATMGLSDTTFADPSGIEVDNVSTATDVAALGFEAFDDPQVKRATTTPSFTLVAAKQTHTVKNTDWLLTDTRNGLYVLGGKTGYLDEAGWNFVVKVKDARHQPLVVVVLGSSDRQQSFNDASALAKWTWANHKWVTSAQK